MKALEWRCSSVCSLAAIACQLFAVSAKAAAAETELPDARPAPSVQVLPLPHDQASFQHDGKELTRYHFGRSLTRPFCYPMAGPGGRSLTRIGHPHDPVSHSHHNSVWISHQKVEQVNFWEDRGGVRIEHQRIEQYADGETAAWLLAVNAWKNRDGKTLMIERRRIEVSPTGAEGDWLMTIDLKLEAPPGGRVTLGQTPFGMIGVRMAKTIGVHDGGGRILNSDGRRNEKEVFRKPARWVDYSGPLTKTKTGGIALMDHPGNPGHPTPFHVRNDGWMGACLNLNGPITIDADKPLRLRYGLWVHAGVPKQADVDMQWQTFSKTELPPMTKQRPKPR